MPVYLIHLKSKLSHAQHYIGWAECVEDRLAKHRASAGARMLAVALERGIEFVLARTWDNQDRRFERRLKKYKKARILCPICSGDRAYNRMKGG